MSRSVGPLLQVVTDGLDEGCTWFFVAAMSESAAPAGGERNFAAGHMADLFDRYWFIAPRCFGNGSQVTRGRGADGCGMAGTALVELARVHRDPQSGRAPYRGLSKAQGRIARGRASGSSLSFGLTAFPPAMWTCS